MSVSEDRLSPRVDRDVVAKYVAEAREAFRTDFSYFEDIITTARRRKSKD